MRAGVEGGQGVIQLPRDILERVERVMEYHRASRHTPQSVAALTPRTTLIGQPARYRTFPSRPKVALPTNLLDLPVGAMPLLREGLNALPDSHVRPPQDLRTLATWLYMAAGVTGERRFGSDPLRLRAYPSAGALFPSEIYVAAFAIEGLEAGLYSFNAREFALIKLREGAATLAQIKRGRPDLAFLKNVPGALLVSTIFCRSAWKYRVRGYRVAVLDAGHVAANLVAAANGLGITTMARLRMNDNTMRELIGIPPEPEFDLAEAVQYMVVWADDVARPASASPFEPPVALGRIERLPLSPDAARYGSILAVHQDCVAPGVPIREIRPPVTEMSPLPLDHPAYELKMLGEEQRGPSLRQVFMRRRSTRRFEAAPIARDRLLAINRAAFRTGTFLPVHPDGPHLGLVRPFWMVHAVAGVSSGIWYYHPPTDRWTMLLPGEFRAQAQALCLGQQRCADASAVCVMVSPLIDAMSAAGPDAYRLAHLEAGVAGQRLGLAADAAGLGTCGIVSFYDDELRLFLGLAQTDWHVLYAVAVGVPGRDPDQPTHPGLGIG